MALAGPSSEAARRTHAPVALVSFGFEREDVVRHSFLFLCPQAFLEEGAHCPVLERLPLEQGSKFRRLL